MGQIIKLKRPKEDFNDQISNIIDLCQEDLESINTLILEN
jgi:hypothetical protein